MLNLLTQDIANDELSEPLSKDKLISWHTVTDSELDEVFPSSPGHTANAARHLIRWCLKGDPAARPTVEEIVSHPFLLRRLEVHDEDIALQQLKPMPMRYRAFLSHAQVKRHVDLR